MAKWTKGQSGNPNGRPKSASSIAQLLRKKVNKTRFVEALLDAAYGGDVRAIGLVLAYTDGLPMRQGDNGRFLQGIKIEVNYVDRERIERLRLNLPRPHSAQEKVIAESRRFNVVCCGRR